MDTRYNEQDTEHILNEMDQDFRAALVAGIAVAVAQNQTLTAPYGIHGLGCEEGGPNELVMLTVHPKTSFSIGVHVEADLPTVRKRVAKLVGPTLAKSFNEDPKNPWGEAYNLVPASAPSWLDALNLGILSEENA